LAVWTEMPSLRAITLFDAPSASSARTSSSRGVSGTSPSADGETTVEVTTAASAASEISGTVGRSPRWGRPHLAPPVRAGLFFPAAPRRACRRYRPARPYSGNDGISLGQVLLRELCARVYCGPDDLRNGLRIYRRQPGCHSGADLRRRLPSGDRGAQMAAARDGPGRRASPRPTWKRAPEASRSGPAATERSATCGRRRSAPAGLTTNSQNWIFYSP
jgi:hypothetical protein